MSIVLFLIVDVTKGIRASIVRYLWIWAFIGKTIRFPYLIYLSVIILL